MIMSYPSDDKKDIIILFPKLDFSLVTGFQEKTMKNVANH